MGAQRSALNSFDPYKGDIYLNSPAALAPQTKTAERVHISDGY